MFPARGEGLEPAANHAPDLIELLRDEQQLLGADPAALMDQPPEDAQFFQVKIGAAQWSGLLVRGRVNGFDGEFEAVKGEPVQSLTEGEALAPGQGCGAVECPAGEVHQQGINRRSCGSRFYLDGLDHRITEVEQHGDYLRYTDDFLLFGDDKARLWDLRAAIVEQLASLRLRLAEPKSRLLATREGVPFCGFRFQQGLRPRVLGATKRRFEQRRSFWFKRRDFGRLGATIFAWYQFSREGNSEGLRRAYVRHPLDARLKRRQRRTSRVLRGASWNNDDQDNLLSSNRNNNTPDNRNDNIGFRCVLVGGGSRKAVRNGQVSAEPAASPSSAKKPSLAAAPAPPGTTGKDAVAGRGR
jgi:hypothetical protein